MLQNMTEYKHKKELALVRFLSKYFHNFFKIIICNLIFGIPLLLLGLFVWFADSIFGPGNIVILSSILFFIYPFYAGVTGVTAEIVQEKDNLKVTGSFFKHVKENIKPFLFHGLFLYMSFLITFFSGLFYSSLAKNTSGFYIMLALCIGIALFLFVLSFYLPLMTVKFQLSIKHIYKNSGLMTLFEIKNNFFVIIGLALFFAVCSTVLIIINNKMLFLFALTLIILLIVPGTVSLIINFCIYDSMFLRIAEKEGSGQTVNFESNKKGVDLGTKASPSHEPPMRGAGGSSCAPTKKISGPGQPQIEPDKNIKEKFSDINIDLKKNDDDFIFYNGRMIKKSVLEKLINDERLTTNDDGER